MSSDRTWMAVQYEGEKVVDAKPFGGYTAASRFVLQSGRARDGWTVRLLAHDDASTLQSVASDDLPDPAPRRAATKPAPAKKTAPPKGAKTDG